MMKLSDEQLTLGELIKALEPFASDEESGAKAVYFDFVYFQPDGLHSYRGYYEQLALGYKNYPVNENCTVEELQTLLRGAVGKTFTGYKGGTYEMRASTPMWVAQHNESGGTAIVGVKDDGWRIVLETKSID